MSCRASSAAVSFTLHLEACASFIFVREMGSADPSEDQHFFDGASWIARQILNNSRSQPIHLSEIAKSLLLLKI